MSRSNSLQSENKAPYARVYHLWAMGVGAVIAGDFYGWQACLAGGFTGSQISILATISNILW